MVIKNGQLIESTELIAMPLKQVLVVRRLQLKVYRNGHTHSLPKRWHSFETTLQPWAKGEVVSSSDESGRGEKKLPKPRDSGSNGGDNWWLTKTQVLMVDDGRLVTQSLVLLVISWAQQRNALRQTRAPSDAEAMLVGFQPGEGDGRGDWPWWTSQLTHGGYPSCNV